MQVKSNINWKKLLQSVALTTIIVAPIFGASATSQAAPPAHAPAYGYRNNDHNDRDDEDWNDRDDDDLNYRDRNRNDNDDNRFYDSSRTLEGVVVNDLKGRKFVLRLDNGRSIRVRLDEREPQRLSDGDRVRVQGSFARTKRDHDKRDKKQGNDRRVFRATDLKIIRNNNNNGRRTVSGVVTNVRSDQRFSFRTLNQSFDVTSSSRLPRGLNRGDRIRVTGDVRDDNISDARVTIIDNNNNNDNDYYGSGNYNNNGHINFPATVIDSNERNNTLRVRGENGREYTVRTNEADDWNRGDRVRIHARSQNGVLIADDIDRR